MVNKSEEVTTAQNVKKIVVVTNQKGGVGKTTVSTHLAMAAAGLGKTLIGDLDTQGNSSQLLTRDTQINQRTGGVELLFNLSSLKSKKLKYSDTIIDNLKLLHGHKRLELLNQRDSTKEKAIALKEQIRSLPFEYIVFDTPTAINNCHIAPLFWADTVIIPVEPTTLSISGLPDMIETVQLARAVNPTLQMKLVINRFEKNKPSQKEKHDALIENFGSDVVEVFALRQAVSDALDHGVPVWDFPQARGLKKQWRTFCENVFLK